MPQTPYADILRFNQELAQQVSAAIPFGLNAFPSAIILDKSEIQQLINQAEGDIIATFGIEDSDQDTPKFTVSFLALDRENKIMCSHIKGELDGAESWPAEVTTNFPTTIDSFDPGTC